MVHPSENHSWPFPRPGAEGLPLRQQEYFQLYLFLLCSEFDQGPNWTRKSCSRARFLHKGTKCISCQHSYFSSPFSSVKLTNLNENLILHIEKNWGANMLPWVKVTVKFQVVPAFRRISTSVSARNYITFTQLHNALKLRIKTTVQS